MKNVLSVLVALAFALSLSTVALAQEKGAAMEPAATAPQKAAGPMKEATPAKKTAKKAAKKTAKKAKTHQITGTVEAINAVAGALTVKGKRATLSLKTGKKAKLDGINKGDKVLVRYTGDTAVSVKKVKGAKKARAKKAAMKKSEAK